MCQTQREWPIKECWYKLNQVQDEFKYVLNQLKIVLHIRQPNEVILWHRSSILTSAILDLSNEHLIVSANKYIVEFKNTKGSHFCIRFGHEKDCEDFLSALDYNVECSNGKLTFEEWIVEEHKPKVKWTGNQIKNKSPYDDVQNQLRQINDSNVTEKDQNRKENKESTKLTRMILHQKILVAFLIPTFIALILVYFTTTSIQNVFSKSHSYQTFNQCLETIDEMKRRLTKQEDMFWLKLQKNACKHLKRVHENNKENLEPFTMLIVGSKGTGGTMDCALHYLTKAFTSKAHRTIFADGLSKQDLDDQIQASLSSSQKYVVVKNMQNLSFDSANLFMSYADEFIDNSIVSFPQSMIVLTAEMPYLFDYTRTRNEEESRVSTYFQKHVWESHNTDNTAALWSRIGSVVILLRPDKSC